MTEHDDSLLVAEYVLGLLERDEANALEERFQSEPKLKKDLLHWSEHFASIYEGVEEVTPSATLKSAIYERLFPETSVAVSDVKRQSSWLWSINWLSGLVLAFLVGFIAYQSQQQVFEAGYEASLDSEDHALKLVARYDGTRNLLQVVASKGLAASGRSFELWLIAENKPPVSLGLISIINNKKISLPPELASAVIGSTLAISDEPEGGSPSGSPTGAVLAAAKVIEK